MDCGEEHGRRNTMHQIIIYESYSLKKGLHFYTQSLFNE